ncbi:MAG: hypothetical protein HYT72_02105 [Candidatus Aenigmarchaeota archaeon]|nr:hypothetical protein [Candidatus Aenigmarchaeota archaeon]
MKGFIEDTIFIVVEVVLIAIFAVLLSRAVGAVFNPDKEVVTLNTELLRSKINEACQFKENEIKLDKFNFPQPKPSRIFGITDFLPTYSISGSGAADPHYVLYYESFPPGEAIGWEAYLDFGTRFIAPFDYAKYTNSDKLKGKNSKITGPEVDKFFKNATAYETEVISKAESFTESEFGEAGTGAIISYIADTEPDKASLPWEKIELNTGPAKNTLKADKGELEFRTPIDGSVVFRRQENESSTTAWMKVKLKVEEARRLGGWPWEDKGVEKIFISVSNAPYRADLIFREDKIILSGEARSEVEIKAKDYHIYKLKMKDGEVTVSVDGKPEIQGKKAKAGTGNVFLFGSADPDNPAKGKRGSTESYWDYIKYSGTDVEPSDIAEQKSELAKKPVLINNIILSDNLNVIPTEEPKPPGSDITKSIKQLGNAGEWIGNRFEFTDYFGLTKEERAYIKYLPCDDNALCLKTRDAVQRFKLDNACAGAKYIQMVYDATGLKPEDLMPAAYIAGDVAGLKALSKAQERLGNKAADEAFTKKFLDTTLRLEGKDPSLLKKENIFKSFFKAFGRKSLAKTAGKFAGPLKFVLIADIIVHQAPDLARSVMEATLRYKNSEFYIASPCQLKSGTITIKYEAKCQDKEELCSEGITYPLYKYEVAPDGTKTIENVGDHFMCLESVGKDKGESEEYKEKYKEEIKADPPNKENVPCIKIKMDDVKRGDFCWTNNPVFPKKGLIDRLQSFVPGKTEALDAIIGCGIGTLITAPTVVGIFAGCAAGAGTSLAVDEASNIWGAVTGEKSLKEHLFVRLGGLPVTEGTSYLTVSDEEKKADPNKYLEAVEMGPTDVIGGSAAKRFGEVAKDFFEIHWAWPR